MEIKQLYAAWLEERRKDSKPPLPSDAHIYIAAFIEWVESRPTPHAPDGGYEPGNYPNEDNDEIWGNPVLQA